MASLNLSSKKQKLHSAEKQSFISCFKKNKMTYLFLVPAIILVFIFYYLPIGGLYMAFVDYNPFRGILGSPFVGLENIKSILEIPELTKAIVNTLWLNLWNVIVIFPLPLIFALLLNEIKGGAFKRVAQTVSYLPHFLSTIAVIGLVTTIYGGSGIVNDIRVALFGEDTKRVLFLAQQDFFVPNVVSLTVWQSLGWSSIIYLSALSGIDPALYEAAIIDGASRWQQCWHITLPSLSVTIILQFILQIGNMFASNFDLIYGLQNVFIDYEVISTIIYKQGIVQGNYSIATAFSFLSGLISLVLILSANAISKKINGISLV